MCNINSNPLKLFEGKIREKMAVLKDLTRFPLTLKKPIILKKMKILRKVNRKWEEIRRRQRRVVSGA